MKYAVYSICNKDSMWDENIMLITENLNEAKEMAERIKAYDKLEPHPEYFSVEIRYNFDGEGNFDIID